MSDSPDAKTAAELAELRERRLIERVTEESRKRVVAYYLTLATGFTAAIALAGSISIPAWIQSTVEARVIREIEAKNEKLRQNTDAIDRIQRELDRRATKQEALLDVAQETVARLRTGLADYEDRVRELQDFTQQVGNLNARIAPLREVDPGEIRATMERLERLSTEVGTLGQQLADLSRVTATTRRPDTAAPAPLEAVAGTSLGVVTQSRTIASELAAIRARNTVYVQFAGVTREAIDALRTNLGGAGFQFPPAERTTAAIGKFEVRYFYPADKEAAERLATAATSAILAALPSERRSAQAADLTTFRGTKPREGTLELWYGPPQ